jgi:hypothetical protein
VDGERACFRLQCCSRVDCKLMKAPDVPSLLLSRTHITINLLVHSYIPFLTVISTSISTDTHSHLQDAALRLQLAKLAHRFHQVLLSTVVTTALTEQRAIDGSSTPFAVAAPRTTVHCSTVTKKRSYHLKTHQKRLADPKSRL